MVPDGTKKAFRVLSLGAGVQSTAVYLLAMHGKIQPIDAAVFADTGDEPQEVYRHLEWLKSLGGPAIHVVRAHERGLGDNLMMGLNAHGGRFVSIPAFTTDGSGNPAGITKRQCTKEYKITPIQRWIRRGFLGLRPKQRIPKGIFVVQLIGISLDETARAIRVLRNDTFGSQVASEFPLLRIKWTRADCLQWMKVNGFPTPPRSACVFCPYKSDSEWLRLKEDPKGWARAVEIDRVIRCHGSRASEGHRDKLYLHRSCQPLEEIDFEKRLADKASQYQQLGFWQECEGMCGN